MGRYILYIITVIMFLTVGVNAVAWSDQNEYDSGQCKGEAMRAYPEPHDPRDPNARNPLESSSSTFSGRTSSGESFSGNIRHRQSPFGNVKSIAYYRSVREYKEAMKYLPSYREEFYISCMSVRGYR